MLARDEEIKSVDLNIDPAKVGSIIVKARKFDARVDPGRGAAGSNQADAGEHEILEGYAADPALEELRGAVDSLKENEIIDLTALAWVGRGDFTRAEWAKARATAREAQCWHSRNYIIALPVLGDHLEAGLAKLGHGRTDVNAKPLKDEP